jgi:hypothetical protein
LPALASAAPWLMRLPSDAGAACHYAAWLAWSATLLLLGALVGTATRRELSGGEVASRAIAQCLLLACWLAPTWPVVALCAGLEPSAARQWLLAGFALGAALAAAVYRLVRKRLGMPEEEIMGVRRCAARAWRKLTLSRSGAPTTTASDPLPDHPAEPGCAPTDE